MTFICYLKLQATNFECCLNWLFGCSFLTGNKKGWFSYGYSSFKGKRASMEDFFVTRISEVDGQMVAFFGVFDGIAKFFAANIFLLK